MFTCYTDAFFDNAEEIEESVILAGIHFFFPHTALLAHCLEFSVYGILR